ncbi:peroxiredoxin [Candidatus Pandoraea novymonadis]|uniref:thioredoxin-dependent peroxiredoxin n=1 Tax=Candidatus Pandoraea novymonadis TaxID=1808959 RepID=A0ABX5FFM9_9BURK|nr:peroxiredoxin [Candidatus Pandoraea novymonadis]PSB92067.1 putative peroxiredoxin bcp [Candidatus Pandoraea novymonadis]
MTVIIDTHVPDFTAAATGGEISLKGLRGRKVIIYFYPKDNTAGCTMESMAFRDAYTQFIELNSEIIGVSRDSLRSHDSFKRKLGLPFPLLSDVEEKICNLFDVLKKKKLYGKEYMGIERSTFLIDTNGILRKEWRCVKVANHVDEVLSAIQAL